MSVLMSQDLNGNVNRPHHHANSLPRPKPTTTEKQAAPSELVLSGYAILIVDNSSNESSGDGHLRLYGTPPDQSQVTDEITEVNGRSLKHTSHEEAADYIRQCIKSRTIRLRVKRRTSNSFIPSSAIKDAYVIAVDDLTRNRIENSPALRNVKAIDMTKISEDTCTNHQNITPEDLTNCNIDTSNCSTRYTENTSASPDHNDNLNKMEVMPAENGPRIVNGYSHPPMSKVPNGGLMDFDNAESPNLSYRLAPAATKEMTDSTRSLASNESMNGHVTVEYGREMPVDCPPDFIAHSKEPPRLPSSYLQNKDQSKKKHKTVIEPTGISPCASSENSPSLSRESTKNENKRSQSSIRELQLKIRQEQEEKHKREKQNEFLRGSLRESEKLRQISERPGMIGVDNVAFVDQGSDTGSDRPDATSPSEQSSPDGRPVTVEPASSASPIPSPLDINDINSLLTTLSGSLSSPDDLACVAQLSQIFQDTKFRNAVQVHKEVINAVSQRNKKPPRPVCTNSGEIVKRVIDQVAEREDKQTAELRAIFRAPNVTGVMYAHDTLAERLLGGVRSPSHHSSDGMIPVVDQEPADALSSPNEDVDDMVVDNTKIIAAKEEFYSTPNLKLISLVKNSENPLGATIRNDTTSATNRVLIGRIVKGGAADMSGMLREGDEILEVNDEVIRGNNINDVCDILAQMTGPLRFLIAPCGEQTLPAVSRNAPLHVRALFDYDPGEDVYIPCRELGIEFQKGDILHVISQEDPNWWQAYRDGEEGHQLAGLIPSRSFQEQREAMKQTILETDNETKSKKSKFICAKKLRKPKKKGFYNPVANDNAHAEEIHTYEDVGLYYPQPNRKRPILLIGPPHVGRHELRQRLINSNSDRFAPAVPHTSRPRADGEVDGRDYCFIPRDQFERDIQANKFAEYGEFQKHLYGTTVDSVRRIINAGKICILNLHPQALRVLKASDVKPYVVFISPPNIDGLRALHKQLHDPKLKQTTNRSDQDEELKEIIEKSREIDENFSHYFDMVVVNTDLDKAYDEILTEINRLEVEPQWVPIQWLQG